MITFLSAGVAYGNAAVYYGHWLDTYGASSSLTAAVGSCSLGLVFVFGKYNSQLSNRESDDRYNFKVLLALYNFHISLICILIAYVD